MHKTVVNYKSNLSSIFLIKMAIMLLAINSTFLFSQEISIKDAIIYNKKNESNTVVKNSSEKDNGNIVIIGNAIIYNEGKATSITKNIAKKKTSKIFTHSTKKETKNLKPAKKVEKQYAAKSTYCFNAHQNSSHQLLKDIGNRNLVSGNDNNGGNLFVENYVFIIKTNQISLKNYSYSFHFLKSVKHKNSSRAPPAIV